jgi:hypothetical protein
LLPSTISYYITCTVNSHTTEEDKLTDKHARINNSGHKLTSGYKLNLCNVLITEGYSVKLSCVIWWKPSENVGASINVL